MLPENYITKWNEKGRKKPFFKYSTQVIIDDDKRQTVSMCLWARLDNKKAHKFFFSPSCNKRLFYVKTYHKKINISENDDKVINGNCLRNRS